jgi:hypothetical protein
MNGHNHHLNNTLCFMMHSDEGTVMNAKYPKAQRPDATTAGSKPRRPSSVVTSAWAVEKAKEKGKTLEEGSFHQRTTTKRPSHSTYPPPMDDASSIASSSISSSVRNVPVSHLKKKKNHVNDPPQQIWKTLQDAKERQNAIRDRVRSYSSGDEFSLSEDMQKPSSRSKNPYEDDEDDSDHHQNIMALPRPQQRPNGIKNKIPLQKKGKEKQHQRPSSPSIRSCSSRSTRQEEDDDSARPLTSDEAVRLVMQYVHATIVLLMGHPPCSLFFFRLRTDVFAPTTVNSWKMMTKASPNHKEPWKTVFIKDMTPIPFINKRKKNTLSPPTMIDGRWSDPIRTNKIGHSPSPLPNKP